MNTTKTAKATATEEPTTEQLLAIDKARLEREELERRAAETAAEARRYEVQAKQARNDLAQADARLTTAEATLAVLVQVRGVLHKLPAGAGDYLTASRLDMYRMPVVGSADVAGAVARGIDFIETRLLALREQRATLAARVEATTV